jgi:hypothetical protein
LQGGLVERGPEHWNQDFSVGHDNTPFVAANLATRLFD